MQDTSGTHIVNSGRYDSRKYVKKHPLSIERETKYFEIELPTAATGCSFIDSESASVALNTLIFAKPGQKRHSRLPYECKFVHFEASGELYRELCTLPTFITVKDRAPFDELIDSIWGLYIHADDRFPLLLHARVLELLHLLREQAVCKGASRSEITRAVEHAMEQIRSDPSRRYSLSEVAMSASFSPIYFHNAFKAISGKTLRDFTEGERIKRAKEMLLNTDSTLTRIAYECGFYSQSHFSSTFKRRVGVTPREFVREYYNKIIK